MGWNSPDNFGFIKTVLCAHSKRLEKLWRWYSLGNTSYSPPPDWFWAGINHTRYAPNVTVGGFSPFARADSGDPAYRLGAQWRFLSGLAFYPTQPIAFVPGLQTTLIEDLTAKVHWTPVPTEEQIENALAAQLYTPDETPYLTTTKEPGFFRVEAVGALLHRARLIWETPIESGSVTQTFLGCGRVQPVPDDSKPSGEFLSRTFVAVPVTPTLLKLWSVRCGCCICGH